MARLVVGVNDLATVNPKLAAEWSSENNGALKPQDVTKSSGRKVWWRHVLTDGSVHEWQATVASRSDGHGCPFCSNIRVLPGFNDLATINPELAAEWSPLKNGVLKPSDVLSGSNRKVWWRCSKGHEWQAELRAGAVRTAPTKRCSLASMIWPQPIPTWQMNGITQRTEN